MLLSITTTHEPAGDLGYLLHKNPARLQSFDLAFGQAHVFYPVLDEHRCTAALLLDVDPIALVRNRRGPAGEGFALEQYVNDRPYVASSFLSVAIAQVYGSALQGRSRERQDLADQKLPLTARLAALPSRGGEGLLRRLFEPLGYTISATREPLDERFPEWGEGPYFTVELAATTRLRDLLSHLYVLVPVLDDEKHYWVGQEEVEKLMRHGEGWLASHPEREAIVSRYLRRLRHLERAAMARLLEEDQRDVDDAEEAHAQQEEAVEQKIRLHDVRLDLVTQVLKETSAKRVLDLGCGSGKLLRRLLAEKQFDEIVGMDVSHHALELAADRLRLESLAPKQRDRVKLIHGSLTYRDDRLKGYDAAAVVEVIEHLDEARLAAFERILFAFARPGAIVLTTPNIEYNVKFESLPAGKLRHKDHRFEWTRQQFRDWSERVAGRFGYTVDIRPVGPEDDTVGAPTQMAVFKIGGTA